MKGGIPKMETLIPVQGYRKVELFKDIIYQLYSKEGRSKVYISKLLKIDRKKLSEKINEWKFPDPEPMRHMKPSTQKFLNKNKNKIKSLLDDDAPITYIANELKIDRKSLINTFIKNDKDLLEAYEFNKYRRKYCYESGRGWNKEIAVYNYSFEDLPGERWKPILGYSKYQISDHGRVKTYFESLKIYKLLKLYSDPINYSGRVYVTLFPDDGSKKKTLQVSRLVSHAFVDGYSQKRNTVNHKDGNVQNNHYTNLEWLSQSENNKHSYDYLNRSKNSGKRFIFNKIIYKDKYEFKTIAALSRFIGKSETQTRRYLEEPEKYEIKLIL